MLKTRRPLAVLLAIGMLGALSPTALADKPGPGEKQCRPGKQNPHCPSSPK